MNEPKRVRLHVRVSETFRNELRNLAAAEDCPVAQVIRRAVLCYKMQQENSYGMQMYRRAAEDQTVTQHQTMATKFLIPEHYRRPNKPQPKQQRADVDTAFKQILKDIGL